MKNITLSSEDMVLIIEALKALQTDYKFQARMSKNVDVNKIECVKKSHRIEKLRNFFLDSF